MVPVGSHLEKRFEGRGQTKSKPFLPMKGKKRLYPEEHPAQINVTRIHLGVVSAGEHLLTGPPT